MDEDKDHKFDVAETFDPTSPDHIPGMGLPPSTNLPNLPQDLIDKLQSDYENSMYEDESIKETKVTSKNRNIACILHILGSLVLLKFAAINIILTVVTWLLYKEKCRYIDMHGRKALNFQLSMLLISISFLLLGSFLFSIIPGVMYNFLLHTKNLRIILFSGLGLPGNIFNLLPNLLIVTYSVSAAIKSYNFESVIYPFSYDFISRLIPVPKPDTSQNEPKSESSGEIGKKKTLGKFSFS